MKLEYNEFCKAYEDKLNLKKTNEKRSTLDQEYIYFSVNLVQGFSSSFNWLSGSNILRLDDEDLKYLHDKYSKELVKEMESNLNEIKEKYKNLKK